jgi:hypothetical protein
MDYPTADRLIARLLNGRPARIVVTLGLIARLLNGRPARIFVTLG